jgi:hypothetical protein
LIVQHIISILPQPTNIMPTQEQEKVTASGEKAPTDTKTMGLDPSEVQKYAQFLAWERAQREPSTRVDNGLRGKPMNVQLTEDNANMYSVSFEPQFQIALNSRGLKLVLTKTHADQVIPANINGTPPPLPEDYSPTAQRDEELAYQILMYGLATHPLAANTVINLKVFDAIKELRHMLAETGGLGPTQVYDAIVALEVTDDFPAFENNFKSLNNQRAAMGAPLDESIKKMMLLASVKRDQPDLHKEVTSNIYMIEGISEQELTFTKTLNIVRDIAKRKAETTTKSVPLGMAARTGASPAHQIEQLVESSIAAAFAAHGFAATDGGAGHNGGRGGGKGVGGRGRRGAKPTTTRCCWVCGATDHIAFKCPNKHESPAQSNAPAIGFTARLVSPTTTTATTTSPTMSYSAAVRGNKISASASNVNTPSSPITTTVAAVAFPALPVGPSVPIAVLQAIAQTSDDKTTLSVVDSGASTHIVANRNLFKSFTPSNPGEFQLEGIGGILTASGTGEAHIVTTNASTGAHHTLVLSNALLVESLPTNLVSARRLAQQLSITYTCAPPAGLGTLQWHGGHIDLLNDRDVHVLPPPPLPEANTQDPSTERPPLALRASPMAMKNISMTNLHRVMGHVNIVDLRHTIEGKHVSSGPQAISSHDHDDCLSCQLAKPRVLNIPKSVSPESRATESMGRVFVDFSGRIEPMGADGMRYTLTMVDDYSGHVALATTKTRSGGEVLSVLQAYATTLGRKPKIIRFDNAKEFALGKVAAWCDEQGIKREFSAPYAQFQNKAERAQQTVWNSARAMMLAAPHVPQSQWPAANRLAATIANRVSRKGGPTAHERMLGSKPAINHLLSYGQHVVVKHNITKKATKFAPRADIAYYLGPAPSHARGVIIAYVPTTKQTQIVRNFTIAAQPTRGDTDTAIIDDCDEDPDDSHTSPVGTTMTTHEAPATPTIENTPALEPAAPTTTTTPPNDPRPSRAVASKYGSTAQRAQFGATPSEYAYSFQALDVQEQHGPLGSAAFETHKAEEAAAAQVAYLSAAPPRPDPPTIAEALRDQANAARWQAAIDKELAALKEHGTYEVVDSRDVPPHAAKLHTKWVLKTKDDGTKKARLTVKGYAQRDVGNTFAPVTSTISMRLLLLAAVMMHLPLASLDVSNAFLQGDVTTPVYLHPFEGFQDGEGKLLKLLKSLYGLRESPHAWFVCLSARLIGKGFIQSIVDRCLFRLHTDQGTVWCVIHVDDCLLCGPPEALTIAEARMRDCFKLRRTDTAEHFLGLHIARHGNALRIHQHKYVADILERFNMTDAHPVPSPTISTRLEPTRERSQAEILEMERVPYAAVVGMLNWLAVSTRPDIAFAVKELARVVATPLPSHWRAAQRVLRYLRNSPNAHIEYRERPNGPPYDIVAYSDADFAGEQDTRKSTSGRIIYVFGNVVVWKAKSQSGIAVSSCESEYIAMSEAVKDIMYIKQVLQFFGYTDLSSVVYGDNLSAVKITKNEAGMTRTRHVDIKYKFLLHQALEQNIQFKWVSTADMTADMMTKGLPAPTLNRHKPKVLSGL